MLTMFVLFVTIEGGYIKILIELSSIAVIKVTAATEQIKPFSRKSD